MNRGEPPTPLKARTGLFTPPGMDRRARSMRSEAVSLDRDERSAALFM
jgi:hypothetical protein